MPPPSDPADQDYTKPARPSTPAGLLKLVLLPALAVLVIVVVASTVSRLMRPGGDAQTLIDTLAERGDAQLPAAVNLFAALQGPGSTDLRSDPEKARRVAEILAAEIEAGRMDPDSLRLRMYLCRALGRFLVAAPMPVLIQAARTERTEAEVDVRLAAIQAVAELAGNLRAEELPDRGPVVSVLLTASGDRRRRIREAAAFALGVVGGQQAVQRLKVMLADEFAEVRYNAATGLARHGDPAGLDVLLEMLDRPQSPSPPFSPARIRLGALQAAQQLAAANPAADLSRLLPAVERIARAEIARTEIARTEVEAEVRVKAVELLGRLSGRD